MTAGPRIAVVDYGAGNLVSIEQALTSVGADVVLVRDPVALRTIDAVILPGVGAAAPAMDRLVSGDLAGPIRTWIADGRPLLGICLGLQLLFDGSDEDGAATLGIVAGRTVRLDHAPTLPHTGWNQVERERNHPLFDGIEDDADFYFVHSYVGVPDESAGDVVLATTEHGGRFVSAVARGALAGVQFHPERSGRDGLRLLANFVDLVRAA
jgi:imidazole glycerol phosphate synthase glutamine amidotransferase subunit